jgi:hypothetical protein
MGWLQQQVYGQKRALCNDPLPGKEKVPMPM